MPSASKQTHRKSDTVATTSSSPTKSLYCRICRKSLTPVESGDDTMTTHIINSHKKQYQSAIVAHQSSKRVVDPTASWIIDRVGLPNTSSAEKRPPPTKSKASSSTIAKESDNTDGGEKRPIPIKSKAPSSSTIKKESDDGATRICALCAQQVATDDQRAHIAEMHPLDVSTIFACTLCDFTNSISKSAALAHAKRVHGSGGGSIVERCDDTKCFPPIIIDQHPQDYYICQLCGRLVSAIGCIRHAIADHNPPLVCPNCPTVTFAQRDSLELHMELAHPRDALALIADRRTLLHACYGADFIVTQPTVRLTVDASTECTLCGAEVPLISQRQHIYRSHLHQPVYGCSRCDFSSTYREWCVRRHIRDVHDDEMDTAQVIDRTDQFESQYVDLREQCFMC